MIHGRAAPMAVVVAGDPMVIGGEGVIFFIASKCFFIESKSFYRLLLIKKALDAIKKVDAGKKSKNCAVNVFSTN